MQNPIETAFRDLRVLAATLIVFGLILSLADRIASNRIPLERVNTRDAIAMGFAQSLALVPVSRSGGTTSAGLLLGYRREDAARFSFLLAVPAVLASGALELTKIGSGNAPAWWPTILATAVAFVVGYLVIAWFLRYIAHHTFTAFVLYRIALGTAVLTAVATGLIPPRNPLAINLR